MDARLTKVWKKLDGKDWRTIREEEEYKEEKGVREQHVLGICWKIYDFGGFYEICENERFLKELLINLYGLLKFYRVYW